MFTLSQATDGCDVGGSGATATALAESLAFNGLWPNPISTPPPSLEGVRVMGKG